MGEEGMDYIIIDPGVQFGRPTIGPLRVPVEPVVELWRAGESVESICEDWPGLTRNGVVVACWYMARYEARRRPGKLWQVWLSEHDAAIWRGDYDAMPLLPQKGEKT